MNYHFLIITIFPSLLYCICNNYYQSSGPSSTKRPFDICYHSDIDETNKQSSYRYYCIESTTAEYGDDSVGGYSAFREDFNSINCLGNPNITKIVNNPYHILCEQQSPICQISRIRQYPIINASTCSYNKAVYTEDINVIGICDDNGDVSQAVFCKNQDNDPYLWTNNYYGGICESNKLFQAQYQFNGCQGDGATYLQILQCDMEVTSKSTSQPQANNSNHYGCSNYWQSTSASGSRRPFDICYRSYRASIAGDYSYRYICNDTFVNENYTVNGYTVWKQFFNGVGCEGKPNATILEDTIPFAIHYDGDDCDIVRYRTYDVDKNDNTKGQCDNPDTIKLLNDYQERVHVIQRCDDDGFVSDSYFCSDQYFYINSYNNDICNNDGIYAAQYYFEGCNGDGQYIEIIECQSSAFIDLATTTTITTTRTIDTIETTSTNSPNIGSSISSSISRTKSTSNPSETQQSMTVISTFNVTNMNRTESTNSNISSNSDNRHKLIWVIIVIMVILGGIIGFCLYQNRKNKKMMANFVLIAEPNQQNEETNMDNL